MANPTFLERSKLFCAFNEQYTKRTLMSYAVSEGPDQPVHPHSLIRPFMAHLLIDRYKWINIWAMPSEYVSSSMCKMHIFGFILRMSKVPPGPLLPLLSIHTFCSSQWFCWGRVKALIRLRGCAVWSGPSLSKYDRKYIFILRGT